MALPSAKIVRWPLVWDNARCRLITDFTDTGSFDFDSGDGFGAGDHYEYSSGDGWGDTPWGDNEGGGIGHGHYGRSTGGGTSRGQGWGES